MMAEVPFESGSPMVAQILANAFELMCNVYTEALQAVRLTDAGEFQQLW